MAAIVFDLNFGEIYCRGPNQILSALDPLLSGSVVMLNGVSSQKF
jgi:hypothetical protein